MLLRVVYFWQTHHGVGVSSCNYTASMVDSQFLKRMVYYVCFPMLARIMNLCRMFISRTELKGDATSPLCTF